MGCRNWISCPFCSEVEKQTEHPTVFRTQANLYIRFIFQVIDHGFVRPHIEVGVAIDQHRLADGFIWHDLNRDLGDLRFALLVEIGVAHKGHMIAVDPFFQ